MSHFKTTSLSDQPNTLSPIPRKFNNCLAGKQKINCIIFMYLVIYSCVIDPNKDSIDSEKKSQK